MTRALEIHEDTQGNLSVWRDPYAWVDPFAEAEEWALRWAVLKVAFARRTAEADAFTGLWQSQCRRVDYLISYISKDLA